MAVMMGAEKGVKTLSEREWQRDLWVYAAPGPPWATVVDDRGRERCKDTDIRERGRDIYRG